MCLGEESITAWIEGHLGERELSAARRHMADCAECRLLVSELARQGAWPKTRVPVPQQEEASTTLSPGARVGRRYRIVRFIARGGMGEIYEAEDLELGERVALKTVRVDLARDEQMLDGLKRETRLARRVIHPNVCRIYDFGRVKRTFYVTMELLCGETLRDRLAREGRMTPAEALPHIVQMAEALSAAHAVGIIHRDFKSANVILTDGRDGEPRAVLSDFGLAMRRGEAHETSGSPLYMAPEQVSGGEITTSVDVYALGVVIHEMVTAAWPFVGKTPAVTALKRLDEEAPSPHTHVADLDPRWERIIMRCHARDPGERFGSPREVARALSAALVRAVSVTRSHIMNGPWVSQFAVTVRDYNEAEA